MKFLRTPLFYFLVLGIGLFVLRTFVGGSRGGSANEIVITEGRVQSLFQSFQLVWQRPPTEAELHGLVDDYVREEVLYREALAMGLDQDDTVIRRRLRQKIEFIAEDVSAVPDPTDEDLRRYLEENLERFRIDPKLSFEHVYVSTDRHGESAVAYAQENLAKLRAGAPSSEMGDPFVLPVVYESQGPEDVARSFGETFSRALFDVKPYEWTGPIESGYGLHLVFIRERSEGRAPDVSEIREELRREWLSVRTREANEAFYQNLRDQYRITVEIEGWNR